jgi:hypothetical protein
MFLRAMAHYVSVLTVQSPFLDVVIMPFNARLSSRLKIVNAIAFFDTIEFTDFWTRN